MRRLLTCALGATLLLTAACGNDADPSSTTGTIRLGLIASQSGPIALQGVQFAHGAQLAVDTINDSGGLSGMSGVRLEIELQDDQGDPQTARQAVSDLADGGAAAIVGPYGSGVCLGAAPVVEQVRLPMVCSGGASDLTTQGYQYLHNIAAFEGYVPAVFGYLEAHKPDVKSIAVLYEDGPYGTNIFEEASDQAPARGFTIGAAISFTSGDPNLRPLVTRAADSGAGAILVGGLTPDVINVLNAVQTTGNAGKIQVIGLSGNVVTEQVADLGEAADGVVGITPWASDLRDRPELDDYLASYQDEFDTPPGADAAAGWAAVKMIQAAIEEAGSGDAADIQDALGTVSIEIGIMPPATYSFDETGALKDQESMMLASQLQDGQFVTVWPEAAAAGSAR